MMVLYFFSIKGSTEGIQLETPGGSFQTVRTNKEPTKVGMQYLKIEEC